MNDRAPQQTRPELLIAATFAGGFLAAILLKRLVLS